MQSKVNFLFYIRPRWHWTGSNYCLFFFSHFSVKYNKGALLITVATVQSCHHIACVECDHMRIHNCINKSACAFIVQVHVQQRANRTKELTLRWYSCYAFCVDTELLGHEKWTAASWVKVWYFFDPSNPQPEPLLITTSYHPSLPTDMSWFLWPLKVNVTWT